MDIVSLLLGESPTDRQAEPKIWRCIVFRAMALVLIGTGPELVSLWLGIAVGLCLRGRAQDGAKAIRDAWRLTCGYTRQFIGRLWHAQFFDQSAKVMVMLIALRSLFVTLSVLPLYQPHFGIPLAVSPPDR